MKSIKNQIELEFRAELNVSAFTELLVRLKREGRKISEEKRLTFMFLGKINGEQLDIRVRTSDQGTTEIVFKKGNLHSHNRREESQIIHRNQIVGFVRGLALLGFRSKVTERKNYNFLLPNEILVTLVESKKIYYVEFEKKLARVYKNKDKEDVLNSMDKFGLKPLSKGDFDNLCERLGRFSDWEFHGLEREFLKLSSLIESY